MYNLRCHRSFSFFLLAPPCRPAPRRLPVSGYSGISKAGVQDRPCLHHPCVMTLSWFVAGADGQPVRANNSTLAPSQGMVLYVYIMLTVWKDGLLRKILFRSRETPGLCEHRLTAKTPAFQAGKAGSIPAVRSKCRVAPCYVGGCGIKDAPTEKDNGC